REAPSRGAPPYGDPRRYVSRILRRIGRPDLVPRYSGVATGVVAVENAGVVVPAGTTTQLEPPITYAAVATPPRSAWAERQFLERQFLERQVLQHQGHTRPGPTEQ